MCVGVAFFATSALAGTAIADDVREYPKDGIIEVIEVKAERPEISQTPLSVPKIANPAWEAIEIAGALVLQEMLPPNNRSQPSIWRHVKRVTLRPNSRDIEDGGPEKTAVFLYLMESNP